MVIDEATLERLELDEWYSRILRGEARADDGDSLSRLLPMHDVVRKLEGTSTHVRTHFLASAQGVPALERIAQVMADAIVDFCVPRKRIAEAMADFDRTRSTRKILALQAEARGLFVESTKSGEGGELLLFLLAERLMGLPQLLSKMPLKTSSSMHVHGTDGIHGKIYEAGTLQLYWGESKLYKSASGAISSCFESIKPFLIPEDGGARNRDLLLLRDHLNVEDANLAMHLIKYFDNYDARSFDVVWNGIALVGFDHDKYPYQAISAESDAAAEVLKHVAGWDTAIAGRIAGQELVKANIEVFCIPFPSVDILRSKVLEAIGVKIVEKVVEKVVENND